MKKVGLALGSGAVRGLIHVGVLKTLIKHKIPIDFIAGSSIGSWVGAHYSIYKDIDKLEELTVGKKWEKLKTFLELSWSGGLVGGKKLEKLLNEWLGGANFKNCQIPLKIVATDLVKGETVTFQEGSLTRAVQASMAVPGVFKPIRFKNRILVDAGISNPVPDDLVKEMGADIVIAVNLDNFQDIQKKKYTRFSDVGLRTAEIMRHYLAVHCMQDVDFIVQPNLSKYASWSDYFTKKDMGREIVEIGERETEKIIPAIKKALQ
jgi:NTE family protein